MACFNEVSSLCWPSHFGMLEGGTDNILECGNVILCLTNLTRCDRHFED
jgi:hypothetical protein